MTRVYIAPDSVVAYTVRPDLYPLGSDCPKMTHVLGRRLNVAEWYQAPWTPAGRPQNNMAPVAQMQVGHSLKAGLGLPGVAEALALSGDLGRGPTIRRATWSPVP